ncbi:MAG: hypothetical protein ACTSYC_00455 [Promethearchaeota archaeon]
MNSKQKTQEKLEYLSEKWWFDAILLLLAFLFPTLSEIPYYLFGDY